MAETPPDWFVEILRDELDIDVTADDLTRSLDELPGWDSVKLLTLLVALERHTGATLSLPDLLEARTLAAVHETATR
ncbi:acyl carrier protein [Actinocorallia sp. API 0066]|uniref:acyl carrier protein n=1 Tax=Actinocorallia sp. API 0066 TaxID=2896846 RepID=UPI001E2B732F|nr:acyl carrier protein [Actinocorallia sp. API 0066]MCD0451591.1 acyl carrier protein [Actinocorallia sp. API 0066]